MTYRELLKRGEGTLKAAGIADAESDARILLFETTGLSLTSYALRSGEKVPENEVPAYLECVGLRAKRIPIQYMLGRASFAGREFAVGEGVLIPRFDTETLTEAILPRLRPGMRLLDLCTGSGCILLTLLLDGPRGLEGTGSDISGTALDCAAWNAKAFGAECALIQSDLFEHIDGIYDIITANPPYIRTEVIETLAPEVRDHEPHLALDGGEDGLDFYRRIIEEAPRHLENGGLLGLEIGYDQAEDVCCMMETGGFGEVTIRRDLAWNTRAVIGVYHV